MSPHENSEQYLSRCVAQANSLLVELLGPTATIVVIAATADGTTRKASQYGTPHGILGLSHWHTTKVAADL